MLCAFVHVARGPGVPFDVPVLHSIIPSPSSLPYTFAPRRLSYWAPVLFPLALPFDALSVPSLVELPPWPDPICTLGPGIVLDYSPDPRSSSFNLRSPSSANLRPPDTATTFMTASDPAPLVLELLLPRRSFASVRHP